MVFSSKPGTLTVWAVLTGALASVLVIVAFATDYWYEVDVNRTSLGDQTYKMSEDSPGLARLAYSHHKGVLRDCYPGLTTMPWDSAKGGADEVCFFIDFNDPADASVDLSNRLHMQRAMLVTCVLGVVLIVVAFILGFAVCCLKHTKVAQMAALSSILGGVCVLTAVVMLHASEYVGANDNGYPGESQFQNNWGEELRVATSTSFGYSYSLAWVGLILACVEGILYLLIARGYALIGGSETDSSSGHSDVEVVVKKRAKDVDMEPEFVYENNMDRASVDTVPVYPVGNPGFIQAMPNYRSLPYYNNVYGKSDY